MTDYDLAVQEAEAYVEKQRPRASPQRKVAFANSVAYLVTGMSGGIGGPSVREHAASRLHGPGGNCFYEQAVDVLIQDNGPIFGPITDLHRACWEEEECSNDDPDDIAELSS